MSDIGARQGRWRAYLRPDFGLWTRLIQFVFLTALIVLTVNSLIPTHPSDAPKYFDKVMHLVAYFVLTGLMAFAFPRVKLFHIFLLTSIYGAVLEVLQGTLAQGRTASLADLLANLMGSAVAVFLYVRIVSRVQNQDLSE